jgi:hypothetical protein
MGSTARPLFVDRLNRPFVKGAAIGRIEPKLTAARHAEFARAAGSALFRPAPSVFDLESELSKNGNPMNADSA